jgi:hypothetical protein
MQRSTFLLFSAERAVFARQIQKIDRVRFGKKTMRFDSALCQIALLQDLKPRVGFRADASEATTTSPSHINERCIARSDNRAMARTVVALDITVLR